MPHAEIVRQLVAELERVGVDPDHMVAGLTSRAEEALRALSALPDGAGPAAFLAELRNQSSAVGAPTPVGAPPRADGTSGR
ncbi:MAG TPA: hypothetical protein VFZ21_11500 [Gemmatimonadaceae bacterium]|jgi:hypothetical protein|nr:hypothetical protein [Gemmatimonadaceae bacterium]